MANNYQNQPKPEYNVNEEIELDETALEEVTGGTQYDLFLKIAPIKLLPAIQPSFTGGVKPSIDPSLYKE